MQLANFRRGLQDHQYLTLARKLGLTGLVDDVLREIVPRVFSDAGTTVSFPETGDPYEAARLKLARAIAEASRTGQAPELRQPVLFDTPEADRILSRLQIFPTDNPWHEDISQRPVHPQSAPIVAGIGADKPLGFNLDMNFVIVPPRPAAGACADHAVPAGVGPWSLSDSRQCPDRELAAGEERGRRGAAEGREHARGHPAPRDG